MSKQKVSLSDYMELDDTLLRQEELSGAFDTLNEYGDLNKLGLDKDTFIYNIIEQEFVKQLGEQ